jgi:hypothetical protein
MMFRRNVLPLIALDAVALNTETTGVDPRKASIVEIGAARIVRGQLDPDAVFQQLVRPGATARSTPERLNELKTLKLGAESNLDDLLDAHGVFLDLILKQQLDDMQRGRRPCNTVEVRRISSRERKRLHSALSSLEHLDVMTRDLLF